MNFGYLLFAIAVLLQPAVHILQKVGINKIGPIGNFGELLNLGTLSKIATNPYIMGGLALSACVMILWLGVLSNMKLSYAFPFAISVQQILLAFMALIFLKEHITETNWIGIAVLVIGCYLINK